jgi:hypothetical protein
MKRRSISFKLLMLMLFFPLNVLFSQDSLIISEFMAINNKTLQDEDSTYSDWIEIFNGGSLPVNLNGWCLSDDATNFSKWPFPAITIDPNEYLVIFASGKNRTSEKDKLHTNFKLSGSGEFLALSNPGASLYNSVFTPAYPEQYDNISYTFYNESYIYSSNPTPGTVNDSGIFVLPPQFSMQHDFYDTPFKLALSSKQKEADIYYTTDASTPSISNGILYSDSIEINSTTVIRAIAVIDSTATSFSTTKSYIFPEDVFTQFEDQPGYPDTWLIPEDHNVPMIYNEIPTHYGMNQEVLDMEAVSENIVASIKSLPIVSIVTDIDHLFSKSTHADSGGIYMYSGEPLGSTSSLLYHLGRGWERPASVEYFNSNEQDGSLDFQENCGLKIHGGASRSTRKTLKRSFKIGFKAEYGSTKLKEEIFGEDAPDQYDRLVLRGGFDRRLENQVVDPWVKSAMRDMGHYAARSKFVHLYLNGMYWGMYNLSEQLDDNCMRDNLGGSASDYDIIKDYYEVEAGNTDAWDQLIALADDPANYQVLLGNHPDGTPDPSNEKLLNPENLVDYVINIVYNNPWDWDNHNWMAARRRTNSEGFHFLVWDAESCLSEGNTINWVIAGGYENRPSGLFSDLMQNQEFRDLFISRVNRSFFEDGALTPDPGLKRYKKWLSEIDTALIADQARWYAEKSDIWNINQHTFIYDYFPSRTEIVFNQFIEAGIYPRIDMPEFNSGDTYIPENFQLLMTGPEAAEILYTVDGSDPGHFSLATSNSIIVYQDSIPLPKEGETLTVYARTKLDTLWSALVKRTFIIGNDPLISIDNSITAQNYLYCYPNPMKDYTNIKYYLSEPSYVTLKVYNATGEYITTLENGEKQQGEHIVIWNSGCNPPGIYFCIFDNYNNNKRYRIKMIKNSYE